MPISVTEMEVELSSFLTSSCTSLQDSRSFFSNWLLDSTQVKVLYKKPVIVMRKLTCKFLLLIDMQDRSAFGK